MNSYDAKVDTALSALNDSNAANDVSATNRLEAFIHAVEAQRGNHLKEADADLLVRQARKIIAALVN